MWCPGAGWGGRRRPAFCPLNHLPRMKMWSFTQEHTSLVETGFTGVVVFMKATDGRDTVRPSRSCLTAAGSGTQFPVHCCHQDLP